MYFKSTAKLRAARSFNQGFTLLELMVVVVIIGILAAAILPNVLGRADDAKVAKAKQDIRVLKQALDMYKLDNGAYPSTDQGLQALIEKPTVGKIPQRYKSSGYLENKQLPMDPWDNAYVYQSPGKKGDVDIISYGADKKPGGSGFDADIDNWQTN